MKGIATKENGLSSLMHGELKKPSCGQEDEQYLAGDSGEDWGMSMSFKHLDPASLPPDWSADFFGNLVDFKLGKTPPRRNSVYWKEGKYPWVSISDMTPHGVVTETSEKVSQQAYDTVFRGCLVPEGSLLMSFKLTIGRISRLGMPAFHNEAIISFQPDQETLSDDFLRYYLSQINYRDYQDTAIKGQTLNKGKLNSLEIALPPLPEQKKIAHILSTVQRAIEAQERIIQTTTELKKTLMRKLFTEGLRNEPQKQTEIGPIPESWEVVELGDLLSIAQYGMSVKGNPEGNYPILRMTNQINGRIVTNDLQFVEIDTPDLKKFKVVRGDILFNRTNSLELVGRTAIYDIDGDYVFASYLIRLRTHGNKLDPFFLNLDFNREETQVRLKSIATRAVSQSNISATRLKDFPFLLPSLPDQVEIVKRVAAFDAKAELHRTKLAALQDLFHTLLHELMTAKTRVHSFPISE